MSHTNNRSLTADEVAAAAAEIKADKYGGQLDVASVLREMERCKNSVEHVPAPEILAGIAVMYEGQRLLRDACAQALRASDIPRPLAEAQFWTELDAQKSYSPYYAYEIDAPELERHTLQQAIAAAGGRPVGFSPGKGLCAIVLRPLPRGALPDYSQEILRVAAEDGAYTERLSILGKTAHAVVGLLPAGAAITCGPVGGPIKLTFAERMEMTRKLQHAGLERFAPEVLESHELPILSDDDACTTLLVGAPPLVYERDGATSPIVPLAGGGTIRDPSKLGSLERAAKIAASWIGAHRAALESLTDRTQGLVEQVVGDPRIPIHHKAKLSRKHRDAVAALQGLAADKAPGPDGGITLRQCDVTRALTAAGLSRQTSGRARRELQERGVLVAAASGDWLFQAAAL